jgi:hypothetical protein
MRPSPVLESLDVSKKTLIDLIAFLLMALVIVVGYKLSPLLLPAVDRSLPLSPCDLQRSACETPLADGARLRVDIGTRPLPLVQAFAVDVQLTGLDAQSVEIDFSGVDMNMGLNRSVLQAQGGGRFSGSATLPVCVTGRMLWELQVIVQNGRERLAVPYRFVTGEARHE